MQQLQHRGGASKPVALWGLAIFLIIVFLTGGSSQPSVQSLAFLRPIAVLVAAYGIFTLNRDDMWHYRAIIAMLVLVTVLTALQLVPLPPAIWHQLPGRDIIVDIEKLVGGEGSWRPFSMVPEATWNALYSLSVPAAVAMLMMQLNADGHRRILQVLLMLIGLSAAVGALQAIGAQIQLYRISNGSAGLLANRNHQAVLLTLLFPMLAAFVATEKSSSRKRIGAITAILIAIIIIPLILITGSRAGLVVGAVAGLLVPLILYRRGELRNQGARAVVLTAAGAAVVVAGLVAATVLSARDSAIMRLGTSSDDIRFPVWRGIVDTLPQYMPWGSGVGSYAEVYQIQEPDLLLRPGYSNHAHNDWLEVVFTTGVPGVLLLLAAIVLFVLALVKAIRTRGNAGLFSRLGLSIVAILAIASLADYPVRTPIMSAILAVAAVWASSFREFRNEDGNV